MPKRKNFDSILTSGQTYKKTVYRGRKGSLGRNTEAEQGNRKRYCGKRIAGNIPKFRKAFAVS